MIFLKPNPKILVIMTGGTIGSKSNDGIIDVATNSYNIVDIYRLKYDASLIEFETIQPVNLLSENFTLETLQTLGNTLLSIKPSNYDGIIITHGSDTLAYTSAFVGMITRHFKIPVIMVASNYELSNPKANGLENFEGAIDIIRNQSLRGCFVVWKDSITHSMNIFLSTRLNECDSYTDNFSAFGGQPFMTIQNHNLVHSTYNYIENVNPEVIDIMANRRSLFQDGIDLSNSHPMLIRTYTGLDYSAISVPEDTTSIVIYLYHSGTACTVNGKYSLLEFISNHKDKRIYVASIKRTKNSYATKDAILKSGAIPLYNISVASAYIKSMLIECSQSEYLMKHSAFFEEI